MLDRLQRYWRRSRTAVLVAFALYVLITTMVWLLSWGQDAWMTID